MPSPDPLVRRRVLAVLQYYLPGDRSGGPVRSLEAWAACLGEELDISVVCLDRDLGEDHPYPEAENGGWVDVGHSRVRYLPPRRLGFGDAGRVVGECRPDVLYVNSVFTVPFGLAFIVAARRLVPDAEIIVAPRGQLCPGALGLKRAKKEIFLRAALVAGLFRGVRWQASAGAEAEDLRTVLGPDASVWVAPNLRLARPPPEQPPAKQAGVLRAIFVSRISPKKNLLFALDVLGRVTGRIELTVAGPVDDPAYWSQCEQRIRALPPHVTVRYVGALPNSGVAPMLASHHVLLLPTLSENYGHVILEALEAGTPVVISDRTPWRGLEGIGAGWDLPLDDIAGFVSAVQACVDLDDDGFRRLSAGARAAVPRLADAASAVEANRALFGLTSARP